MVAAGFVTKDSGVRAEFATGSKRDTSEGKGRYDLIPWDGLELVGDWCDAHAEDEHHGLLGAHISEMVLQAGLAAQYGLRLDCASEFLDALCATVANAMWAIERQETGRNRSPQYRYGIAWLPREGVHRYAQLLERGADKYAERNWELGQPYSRVIQSMLRHAQQANAGLKDEDHLAAVIFNALAILTFEVRDRADLNDYVTSDKGAA